MKDTKERILSHGLGLLAESGFGQVTVGALAQRTGLSKSGLFAHFGSKVEVQLSLLEETLRVGSAIFIEPALRFPPGLKQLRVLVFGWLGWPGKAGLNGGCPIAAGFFEFDDAPQTDPVRQRLFALEGAWRELLADTVKGAIDSGDLREDLDIDQFVWELCGIYLSHHASSRFIGDPKSDQRASVAFEALLERATIEAADMKRPVQGRRKA